MLSWTHYFQNAFLCIFTRVCAHGLPDCCKIAAFRMQAAMLSVNDAMTWSVQGSVALTRDVALALCIILVAVIPRHIAPNIYSDTDQAYDNRQDNKINDRMRSIAPDASFLQWASDQPSLARDRQTNETCEHLNMKSANHIAQSWAWSFLKPNRTQHSRRLVRVSEACWSCFRRRWTHICKSLRHYTRHSKRRMMSWHVQQDKEPKKDSNLHSSKQLTNP